MGQQHGQLFFLPYHAAEIEVDMIHPCLLYRGKERKEETITINKRSEVKTVWEG
jgi:hypothetical protein